MNRPIIDLDVLQELRDSAGPEFTAELAQTFAEDLPQMLAALGESRNAGDAVAFRRAAHALKSNASTFGALPLADMARCLEHSDPATVGPPAMQALRDACGQAVTSLQELLP